VREAVLKYAASKAGLGAIKWADSAVQNGSLDGSSLGQSLAAVGVIGKTQWPKLRYH
jgi:hypothetical protein